MPARGFPSSRASEFVPRCHMPQIPGLCDVALHNLVRLESFSFSCIILVFSCLEWWSRIVKFCCCCVLALALGIVSKSTSFGCAATGVPCNPPFSWLLEILTPFVQLMSSLANIRRPCSVFAACWWSSSARDPHLVVVRLCLESDWPSSQTFHTSSEHRSRGIIRTSPMMFLTLKVVTENK